jgi:hypothetical protein
MTTPCSGLSWLFDSVHPADHLAARERCLPCPLREECLARADQWSVGTWGGVLFGAPGGSLRRLREDQAFSDDDARDAHARFYLGQRDDRTRAGERVYQRRMARVKRRGAA